MRRRRRSRRRRSSTAEVVSVRSAGRGCLGTAWHCGDGLLGAHTGGGVFECVEGVAMSYIKGYDPDTLREKVDPHQCRERLDEIGEQRSLPALLERVWLLKVLDRSEDALVVS